LLVHGRLEAGEGEGELALDLRGIERGLVGGGLSLGGGEVAGDLLDLAVDAELALGGGELNDGA
jgi:hypothetical protein